MKIGESVVLKSGSTIMTVEKFRQDGCVICVWFDDRDKVHRNTFPAETLRVVKH